MKQMAFKGECPSCHAPVNLTFDWKEVLAVAQREGLMGVGVEATVRWASSLETSGNVVVANRRMTATPGVGWELVVRITKDGKTRMASFPIIVGESVQRDGQMLAWGVERLGNGVWKVRPSIVADDLHVILLLVDVPEPAPFME